MPVCLNMNKNRNAAVGGSRQWLCSQTAKAAAAVNSLDNHSNSWPRMTSTSEPGCNSIMDSTGEVSTTKLQFWILSTRFHLSFTTGLAFPPLEKFRRVGEQREDDRR